MVAGQPSIAWPALIAEALEDVEANKPLAPSAPMTEQQIAAMMAAVHADLPLFIAAIRAHPGVLTAACRVLAALASQGQPWAATALVVLQALPGGLAMAQQYLPTVLGLLTAFSPAPQNPDLTTNARGR